MVSTDKYRWDVCNLFTSNIMMKSILEQSHHQMMQIIIFLQAFDILEEQQDTASRHDYERIGNRHTREADLLLLHASQTLGECHISHLIHHDSTLLLQYSGRLS